MDEVALLWWYALLQYGLWYVALTAVYMVIVAFWPRIYVWICKLVDRVGGRGK